MNPAPTALSLVERFRLTERGRERGQDGQPHATQPTLDNVEMEVVGYCDDLYANRRNDYYSHRSALEERLRPPPADRGAEPLAENTCKEMKDAVAEERPDLSRLTREAQRAIGELNRFKREEGRTADADYPESRVWHWGVLVALVLLEALVNGLFFGANVEGGILAGTTYAILISLVNVGVLGWLFATLLRQVHHRDPRRKVGGLVTLAAVGVIGIFWNLFVAHYREALPPDYPAQPDTTVVAEAPAAESMPEACWHGPDEADADQEALCLFRASPFGLTGFYSWMLLVIGLAMCAAAAIDWYKTDDPYPGYGARERHRRKTEKKLLDDRRELLGDLNELHDEAARKLRAEFRDPVEARQLALNDHNKLHARHTDLCGFARDLEKSCRGALDIYRTANREARSAPEPEIWQNPWAGDWDLPEPPDKSDLVSDAEAEKRSLQMHALLEQREQKLRDCHDECHELVIELTKLDPHDKAVPT